MLSASVREREIVQSSTIYLKYVSKNMTLVMIRVIQVKVSCTKNSLNLLLHDHFPPTLTFKQALLIYL